MRELHPNRGPHDPRPELPLLKAGSVRRTTTIDTNRPHGIAGIAVVDARSRDMRVGEPSDESSQRALATAQLQATVDYIDGRRLLSVDILPQRDLSSLVGNSIMSGFRDRMDTAYPDGRGSHSLSYQLLDDLPTALLVSGFAFGAAGFRPSFKGSRQQYPDLCAGFIAGGSMLLEEAETGQTPTPTGPVAPNILAEVLPGNDVVNDSSDSGPCHSIAALGAHGMRRLRVIDVWPNSTDGRLVNVENYFRDSHMSTEGLETVVHEYTVLATFDLANGTFQSTEATAHTLPWTECPLAIASATRVSGTAAKGMRNKVRSELVGPSTCTHLNDTLRAMEDVPGLAELLDR